MPPDESSCFAGSHRRGDNAAVSSFHRGRKGDCGVSASFPIPPRPLPPPGGSTNGRRKGREVSGVWLRPRACFVDTCLVRRPRLEMNPGEGRLVLRTVLFCAAWFGFRWLLGYWHTPLLLFVIAMVAVWFVLVRYRWIDAGERKRAAAVQEMERALIEEIKKDSHDEDAKP